MKYRWLDKSGLQVSELCLGTMTFGEEAGEGTARTIIDRFLDAGGNFVDTADVYGKTPGLSEEIVGRALKGSRIARAKERWEEAWSRRATEKNFRILDVIGEITSSRGKSYAQVALAWVRSQPGVTSPIIGVRTLEQLKDNLGSVGWELTSEELEALDKVSRLEWGYPYRFLKEYGRK